MFGDEVKFRITDAILRKSIAKELNVLPDDVQIDKVDISPGAASVEETGFTCVMYAVKVQSKVNGKDHTSSFMAKCGPAENHMNASMIEKGYLFSTEVFFYKELLEKLNEKRCQNGKSEMNFFAKCYYASMEDKIIVFQNLKDHGYSVNKTSAKTGLSEDEVTKVLQYLAIFHAANYNFLANYPGGRETLLKAEPGLAVADFLSMSSDEAEKAKSRASLGQMWDFFVDVLRTEQKGDQELAKRLDAVKDTKLDLIADAQHFDDTSLKTLIHGDAWANNFMFKYKEDGQMENICFVDLQVCRLASPAIELIYFFSSSAPKHIWQQQEQLNLWMKKYHDFLSEELTGYGYEAEKLYSFDQLKADYKKASPFGLFISFMHLNRLIFDSQFMAEMGKIPMPKPDDQEAFAEYFAQILKEALKKADTVPGFHDKVIAVVKEAVLNGVI